MVSKHMIATLFSQPGKLASDISSCEYIPEVLIRATSYSAEGYRSMPMCLSRNLTASTWFQEAAKGDCRPDDASPKSEHVEPMLSD